MSAETQARFTRTSLLGWIALFAAIGALFGTVGPSLALESQPPVQFWLVIYVPAVVVLLVFVIAAGWCGFTLGARLVTRSALEAHVAGVFLTGLFGVVVFGIASATGVFAVVWPDAVFAALCFAMIGGLVARRRLGPAISWGAARTR